MKKIVSLITVVMLLTGIFQIGVTATGGIEIISPVAGINTDLTEIKVDCSGAEKIIFELDGGKLGETAGETTFSLLNTPIAPGNHTLKVFAIFADKTAEQAVLDFNVSKKVNVQTTNMQDFDALLEDVSNLSDVSMTYSDQYGKHEAGVATAVVATTTGKSGAENDKALNMKMNVNNKVTKSAPYLQHTSFVNYAAGIATFKFDLKLDNYENVGIRLGNMPLWNTDGYFIYDGYFYGLDKAVDDEWMSVEMVSDFSNEKVLLKVNDEILYDGPFAGEATATSPNFRMTLFQTAACASEEERAGISIDNVNFTQDFLYGLDKILWCDSEETWIDYTDPIPVTATKLRVTLTEKLKSDSVTAENVKLYENGKIVSVSDIAYDSETNSITVTPEQAFSKGSDVILELSDKIKLSNGTETGAALQARVKTQMPPLTPGVLNFKKNGSLLISGAQLETGDVVSVEIGLNNDTDQPKNVAAVVCVRQNGKLRALGAVEKLLAAGENSMETVTLPALSQLDTDVAGNLTGDASVKVLLCDGLTSTKPYMAYSEIK